MSCLHRHNAHRHGMLRTGLIAALALLLSACGGAVSVPEFNYYRLGPRVQIERAAGPVTPMAIVVDSVVGEGVHGEQPLAYSTDPAGLRLRQYHYHLWSDPPGRLLQRRLIATLREAGLSHLVTDRLAGERRVLRVRGLLEAFERVRGTDEQWRVRVSLQLRVDSPDSLEPLLLVPYSMEKLAESGSIQASVRAFAAAVDEIYGDFAGELTKVLQP